MLPKLNRKRAQFVMAKIDEILAWEQRKEAERDTRFVELGRYLCEVRAGQYWRLENLKSFDEFLTRRFPESRRKAYYLMSIHEHLPPQARRELKEVGWTKGLELAKVARRDRQEFDCATWLHKARSLPKEEFKREVEKELTGKDAEPWEIIYFKFYKSQIPVIEQAIETAALMLGTDKSRGYCLEMICADFLGGGALGERRSGDLAAGGIADIQLPDRRAETAISGKRVPEGLMIKSWPKRSRIRLNWGGVCAATPANPGARWLALSGMRIIRKPSGSPSNIPESIRPRLRREPDHTLCSVPCGDTYQFVHMITTAMTLAIPFVL